MTAPLSPDPMWSVCPLCWCVIASVDGHAPACNGAPPEGADLIIPDDPGPEPSPDPDDPPEETLTDG